MTFVFLALAILVILGLVLVLVGRLDPDIEATDRPAPSDVPDLPWTSSDVRNLKFRVGLRGYRMEDVDSALSLLALQLDSQAKSGDVQINDEPDSSPSSSAG